MWGFDNSVRVHDRLKSVLCCHDCTIAETSANSLLDESVVALNIYQSC
jgi:hypothetical protein